jgi:Helitron helicase-like domain at N-terminus
MAICRHYRKPDLFVTFTCNAKRDEIQRELLPGQKVTDRPDLVARVFHLKLKSLLDDLLKKHVLGRTVAHCYVVEFQKRGLPHAHILLILAPEDKIRDTAMVDNIVSAEIPDPHTKPKLCELVTSLMMHRPCGQHNSTFPCMNNTKGECSKHFPKPFASETKLNENGGYPIYKQEDNGR